MKTSLICGLIFDTETLEVVKESRKLSKNRKYKKIYAFCTFYTPSVAGSIDILQSVNVRKALPLKPK